MLLQRSFLIAFTLVFIGTTANLMLELMEVNSQFSEATYTIEKLKLETIEEIDELEVKGKISLHSSESSSSSSTNDEKENSPKEEEEEEEEEAIICKGELSTEAHLVDSGFYVEYSKHANQLKEKNLCSSFNHQNKFFSVKDRTLAWLKEERQSLLFQKGRQLYAISINENYAIRHIFKNAGSTIIELTGAEYIQYEEYEHSFRKLDNGGHYQTLIAVVRDPISHFLSGWAECGRRSSDAESDLSFASSIDLNSRVQNWLNFTQRCIEEEMEHEFWEHRERTTECLCMVHSMPQVNFLLDHEDYDDEDADGNSDVRGGDIDSISMTFIDRNLGLIGDIGELYGILEVAGHAHKRKSIPWLRKSANTDSEYWFPQDPKLLSDETILKICEFVIIDYYFLAYEPPAVCRDRVVSDMQRISEMTVETEK